MTRLTTSYPSSLALLRVPSWPRGLPPPPGALQGLLGRQPTERSGQALALQALEKLRLPTEDALAHIR